MWLRRAGAAGHCLLTTGLIVFLELQSQSSTERNCHARVPPAGLCGELVCFHVSKGRFCGIVY